MNQDQAFDIMTMGYNVFLTGEAGSGKTYLVNRYMEYCREHSIMTAITASTGIAATHISGVTIHSWSGMGIRDTLTDEDIEVIRSREYLMKRFAKTQVLVIDEVSLLSGTFLASLDRLLRLARVTDLPFWGMQVILVGDFFQLPPVVRGMSTSPFAFESEAWKGFKLAVCYLTTQYRQWDDPLRIILADIRRGVITTETLDLLKSRHLPIETEDHTELFTKNLSVDAYNTDRLNAIHDDTFIFEMESHGATWLTDALKKGCLAPETLVLKKWARVMFVKNNFEAGYANGSIGHVTGKFEWLPIVELLDGTRIIADWVDWSIEEGGKIKASISQIPLRLAWAITVHKSQGMTLDTAVMDLSDAFVLGQGYVALSRVRTLAGLILRGLNDRALQVDPRVIDYDEILRATATRTIERLDTLSVSEKSDRQKSAILRFGGSLETVKPHESKKNWPKWSTLDETYVLLVQKYTLAEIAERRELKVSTVMTHVEDLIKEWRELNLDHLKPDDTDRLNLILSTFDELQTESLSRVRESLGEGFNYDEIRIARLFL
jgi:ATP-dependent DNA helicase PIF1